MLNVVSSNEGKIREFKEILGSRPDVVYQPFKGSEIQGDPKKIVEDKARQAWSHGKVLVEETFLYIEGLGHVKGESQEIYDKTRLLNSGTAKVESWICLYDGIKFITRSSTVLGEIVSPRGNNGFGWDQIFQPNKPGNLTYAEMDQKNNCSFRRLSIEKIRPYLRKWNVDVVVGCEWGDEAKGKIVCYLLTTQQYTHGVRWQGSCNAGHTIYILHQGQRTKVVTHMVPSTVLYGISSVIGDACKIDPRKLQKELEDLEKYVPDVRKLVKISANCGLISEEHIAEDKSNDLVGTTHSGVGQCNRDYYDRKCQRVADVIENGSFCGCEVISDTAAYWMQFDYLNVIAEGAQGYELGVTGSHYPYVTSTHCDPGFLNTMGFNPHVIGTIYGAAKIYTTYVGSMPFGDPDDPIIQKIQKEGGEFGATTGRPRKVDWLDITRLRKACIAMGVNYLVISKCDVLKEVGVFCLYEGGELLSFVSLDQMMSHITDFFDGYVDTIKFSFSPDHI